MINDPKSTVWLRLICVLLVFFVLSVALGSQPVRSKTVNTGRVLKQSAEFVLMGPVFPLSMHNKSLGVLGAVGFWCALIGAAFWSEQPRARLWFHLLFGVYLVMTSIAMLGGIGMGLISMTHAL